MSLPQAARSLTKFATPITAVWLLPPNATLNFTLPSGLSGANYSFSGPAISLRAGTTYIWNIPSIPIGATGIITVQAQVNSAINSSQVPHRDDGNAAQSLG